MVALVIQSTGVQNRIPDSENHDKFWSEKIKYMKFSYLVQSESDIGYLVLKFL